MELDFENEGHNQEKCARQLRHMPFVHVPVVEWDLTTKVSVIYLMSASKIKTVLFFVEGGLYVVAEMQSTIFQNVMTKYHMDVTSHNRWLVGMLWG